MNVDDIKSRQKQMISELHNVDKNSKEFKILQRMARRRLNKSGIFKILAQ